MKLAAFCLFLLVACDDDVFDPCARQKLRITVEEEHHPRYKEKGSYWVQSNLGDNEWTNDPDATIAKMKVKADEILDAWVKSCRSRKVIED